MTLKNTLNMVASKTKSYVDSVKSKNKAFRKAKDDSRRIELAKAEKYLSDESVKAQAYLKKDKENKKNKAIINEYRQAKFNNSFAGRSVAVAKKFNTVVNSSGVKSGKAFVSARGYVGGSVDKNVLRVRK